MALVVFDGSYSPNVPSGPKKAVMVSVSYAANTSIASCDVLDFRNYKHLAVRPGVGMTGVTVWAAASSTLAGFNRVNDFGTSGSVAVSATQWITLDPNKLAPYSYLQIQAGATTGTIMLMAST